MADFPTFPRSNGQTREDSSKFGFDTEDVGIRSDMDGGYVLTRPRHTRTPRRIYMTGFSAISQANYTTFLTFWNTYGTYGAFNYKVPTTSEIINVRFKEKPKWKATIIGATYLWDIDVVLEEV